MADPLNMQYDELMQHIAEVLRTNNLTSPVTTEWYTTFASPAPRQFYEIFAILFREYAPHVDFYYITYSFMDATRTNEDVQTLARTVSNTLFGGEHFDRLVLCYQRVEGFLVYTEANFQHFQHVQ